MDSSISYVNKSTNRFWMRKYNFVIKSLIGLLVVILLYLIHFVRVSQERQYYYVNENLSITIWHDYIIFGHYTSFFQPNMNKWDYIHIPNSTSFLPFYIILHFEDNSHYVLYSYYDTEIRISQHQYILKGLYCGRNELQYDNYLKYEKNFLDNKPLCEIELGVERGRYMPSINLFFDSMYVRTVYDYPDILMHHRDSLILELPLEVRLEQNRKAINSCGK